MNDTSLHRNLRLLLAAVLATELWIVPLPDEVALIIDLMIRIVARTRRPSRRRPRRSVARRRRPRSVARGALQLHDVMIVIDANNEDLAIKEANVLGIPVVAVLDTNVDPSGIAFPVPGNDDAARAVRLYCDAFGEAAQTGKGEAVAQSGQDFGSMENPPAEAATA